MNQLFKYVILILSTTCYYNYQIHTAGSDDQEQLLKQWFAAANSGNITLMQTLIKKVGVNAINRDSPGGTALIAAVCEQQENIVKLLLSDPDINVNAQDTDGNNALVVAAYRGYKNIVKLLLSMPTINVNIQNNDGENALISACDEGHEDIVTLLLNMHKINVNIQDNNGSTALMLAAHAGYVNLVQRLLEDSNIDPNVQDNNYQTALKVAFFSSVDETDDSIISDLEQIMKLLAHHSKTDINIQDKDHFTILMDAAGYCDIEFVRFLLEIPGIIIYPALTVHMCTGQTRDLIKNKVDALTLSAFKAIEHNDLDTLKSVTTQIGIDNVADANGTTLIDKAFQCHSIDSIELLLQNAKNPKKLLERFPFEFMNPTSHIFQYFINLAYGQESFQPDVFEAIRRNNSTQLSTVISDMQRISTKVNLNFCDTTGQTPLFKAIKQNNMQMVALILNAHPEILFDLVNKYKQNPIELAIQNVSILNFFMDLAYADQLPNKNKSTKRKLEISHGCAYCLKPDCSKRCSNCKAIYYCSDECQKAHWRIHKLDCQRYKNIKSH